MRLFADIFQPLRQGSLSPDLDFTEIESNQTNNNSLRTFLCSEFSLIGFKNVLVDFMFLGQMIMDSTTLPRNFVQALKILPTKDSEM